MFDQSESNAQLLVQFAAEVMVETIADVRAELMTELIRLSSRRLPLPPQPLDQSTGKSAALQIRKKSAAINSGRFRISPSFVYYLVFSLF